MSSKPAYDLQAVDNVCMYVCSLQVDAPGHVRLSMNFPGLGTRHTNTQTDTQKLTYGPPGYTNTHSKPSDLILFLAKERAKKKRSDGDP